MAFRLAVLCSLLAVSYGLPHDRVTGGVESEIEAAPWTASVEYERDHVGAAVIVSHLHALTTASAVDEIPAPVLFVRVGSTSLYDGGLLKAVGNVTIHPEYNQGAPQNNDIAVIQFRFRLAFSDRIRAIPIAGWTGQSLPQNSALVLSGWQLPLEEDDSSEISENLQVTELRLVPRAECTATHGNVGEGPGAGQPRITANMFCANHFENGGNTACAGASGSPAVLVSENVTALVGLSSWFTGCGTDSAPGVYTIVSTYFPWIRSVAGGRPQQFILN